MFKEGLRPAWVEIDLRQLDKNIKIIKSKVTNGAQVCGVVKANAYGHGMLEVVKTMQENDIHCFAVATLSEGVKLRENGITDRILMLSLVPDMYVDTVCEYNITTGFSNFDYVKALSAEAEKRGVVMDVLGVVDTGMGRIGYQAMDPKAIEEIEAASHMPGLNVVGIFSHLSNEDEEDKSFSDKQEKRYNYIRDALLAKGMKLPLCSFANSPATTGRPSCHFDLCRPGGTFYGRYQHCCVETPGIEPIMSVKANIVHIKNVPEGFSVSYNRSLITKRPSTIATLAMGYADGIPRPWCKEGHAIVNGRFAPFAGVICMDQCMLDVTDIPNVKMGDEVVLIGKQGDLEIRSEDIGNACGTIANNITCGMDIRLPYLYIR